MSAKPCTPAVRVDIALPDRLRLKNARRALGLTDRQMAEALQLRGENAKDDLRKMEDGMRPVTGPVLVAAEALVKLKRIEDEDLDDLIRELAETPTSTETPGTNPGHPREDELIDLARTIARDRRL